MNINFLKYKKMMISMIAIVVVGGITIPLLRIPQDKTSGIREREYTAKKDNITVGVETSGQINTLPNMHSFEENTVVDEVFTKLGSEVKKGDKLATISTDNLSELINVAKDQLSDAKISLLQAASSKDVMLSQNNKNKQDGLDSIHQQFDTKFERLTKEKDKILASIEANESKMNKFDEEIARISPNVKEYETKIRELKEEINKNILKIGELDEKLLQVDTSSEERKKLNEKIANLQYDIQKLKEQLSNKMALESDNITRVQQLQLDIQAKRQEITVLEKALSEAVEEQDKLDISRQIQQLNDEIQSKRVQINNLSYSGEMDRIQSQIDKKEKELKEAQSKLNNLSDGSEEMNAIRLEITKLQNRNTALQQQIDKILENNLVAELEKLKDEKKALQENIEKEYDNFSLKLEEIQEIEKEYEQALQKQGKDNTFGDYKVSQEIKAINESISKANRNVGDAQEKLNKLLELEKNPTLYAQMDGVITALNYKAGDVVMNGKPLCIIGELNEITMTVPVSASDIGNVSIGQKANVFVDAFAEQKFTGTVIERLLVANDNGDYPVTISINSEEQMVLPGMKAFASIVLKEKQDILTISNKAILLENGEQYVNVKNENGEIIKKKITTGFSDGRISEVLDGLSENDIAVVQE